MAFLWHYSSYAEGPGKDGVDRNLGKLSLEAPIKLCKVKEEHLKRLCSRREDISNDVPASQNEEYVKEASFNTACTLAT